MAMIALKIITPLGLFREKEVKSISVRTVQGQMVLLPNHMPIVAALVPCHLKVTDADDKVKDYALAGGFLQFDENKCLILSDAVEGRSDIDLARAKEAYQRARNRIDKKDTTTNMKRAELALQRAVNRINVAGK